MGKRYLKKNKRKIFIRGYSKMEYPLIYLNCFFFTIV
nr:MAG TPA: hypothetical protein [Caudoviricetes sp.]